MRRSRAGFVALSCAALIVALAGCASPALPGAGPQVWTWADPATAGLHPGLDVGGCVVGFVVTGERDLYVTLPASCVQRVGASVALPGAAAPGVVAFRADAASPGHASHDLALVRIDPADWANVSPALPSLGGPTGLATPNDLQPRQPLFLWGAAPTVPLPLDGAGPPAPGWSSGVVSFSDPPWSLEQTSLSIGASGGMVVDTQGRAVGLRTLQPGSTPGAEVVVPLWMALHIASTQLGPLSVPTFAWSGPGGSATSEPADPTDLDVPGVPTSDLPQSGGDAPGADLPGGLPVAK